jgi:uncharacterized cupin superfamily protein
MTLTIAAYPTFVDLCAFAAAAEPAADPFGAGRTLLPLRAGPVEVGAVALAAGRGAAGPMAGDWWLVAATGSVRLTVAGEDIVLAGAQSCVITDGATLSWQSAADATLLFMRYVRGAGSPTAMVPVDLAATLAPSGAPLAELLTTPTPACRNHTDYRSADGAFTCGVWDSTAYTRTAMRYAHFELMVLLKGEVTFVDEAGRKGTFGAGEIFLVEQGASCAWDSSLDVAKVYAIYRPVG